MHASANLPSSLQELGHHCLVEPILAPQATVEAAREAEVHEPEGDEPEGDESVVTASFSPLQTTDAPNRASGAAWLPFHHWRRRVGVDQDSLGPFPRACYILSFVTSAVLVLLIRSWA